MMTDPEPQAVVVALLGAPLELSALLHGTERPRQRLD